MNQTILKWIGFGEHYFNLDLSICKVVKRDFCFFCRAGKTEVLTDDLQAADKHVDQIRMALIGLNKRLGNPPNQAIIQDVALKEKRLVIHNEICI